MAKLEWDKTAERSFEMGVDHGVLYVQKPDGTYNKGVVWNGLTAVTEKPDGAEPNDLYADNIKYASLRSAETYGATIEAFMYPEEFAQCDGSAALAAGVYIGQQTRKGFGLCYRTKIGNDVAGDDFGYKLHLIYGCRAAPSERGYATINDSPEAITFSWELSTTPVQVPGYEPTSQITIPSTDFESTEEKAKLTLLENVLFGTEGEGQSTGTVPTLPLPEVVEKILDGTITTVEAALAA